MNLKSKKLLLAAILLSFNTVNIFAQCEYINDTNATRLVGISSSPLCSGNYTYCSKNGWSVFPHSNYRILVFYTRQVALAPAGLFAFYSRQSRSTAGCLESVY
ncbi:MAG: hypothetical protein BWX95_02002 [Bacteroidetes bacterium ADurb.Bin141]|nr:MAG: hypothetical protein BWX95_02002 [Bacteroidetes bacterium ADurb.Bin141]